MYEKIKFNSLKNTDAWEKHIRKRFSEAKELKLIDPKCKIDLKEGVLVSPSEEIGKSIRSTPDVSLRDLLNLKKPNKGWSERPDMFSECAQYIAEIWLDNYILVCEAGYKKIGDRSLSGQNYYGIDESVFVYSKSRLTDAIQDVLLLARSWRFIGAIGISAEGTGNNGHIVEPKLFLCDAYDNDSLFFAGVYKD